jgi:porin
LCDDNQTGDAYRCGSSGDDAWLGSFVPVSQRDRTTFAPSNGAIEVDKSEGSNQTLIDRALYFQPMLAETMEPKPSPAVDTRTQSPWHRAMRSRLLRSQQFFHPRRLLVAAIAALSFAPIAKAQDEAVEPMFAWLPHQVGPLTGQFLYTGEAFNNARGGLDTNGATRYRGNLDVVVEADLEQAFNWTGGKVFVYGGNSHGRTLSETEVGDFQLYSNIDSFPFRELTQLHEYWFEQAIGDQAGWVRLGRIDANRDFAFADVAGDFVHNSFVTIPTVVLPVWPKQNLGGVAAWSLSETWTVAGGLFDGEVFNNVWGDNRSRGMIGLGHLEAKPQWGIDGLFPGTYRLGAWIHSGQWGALTADEEPEVFGDNYGIWASAEQMLWIEGRDVPEQGLAAFYVYGAAPGDRNIIGTFHSTGLVYRGPLENRDSDVVGVGMNYVGFGSAVAARDELTYENAIELFYKAAITPSLSIQPDLQFIANPGGNGQDALLLGIRIDIVL